MSVREFHDKVQSLCDRAIRERDAGKLLKLIRKISDLLEEEQKRLTEAGPINGITVKRH